MRSRAIREIMVGESGPDVLLPRDGERPLMYDHACGLFWTNVASTGDPPCAGCEETRGGGTTLRLRNEVWFGGSDVVVRACPRCWPAWPKTLDPALTLAVLRAADAALAKLARLQMTETDVQYMLAHTARIAELIAIYEAGA